jgi:hypothetical protein
VRARLYGATTAKAGRRAGFTERPLMPSECPELVQAATEVAPAREQVAVDSRD